MTGDAVSLARRVALVTGARQGIGAAITDRLLADGAQVVAVDINEIPVGKWSAETAGGALVPIVADVSSREAVNAAVDGALGHFGHLDIAVCNAGLFQPVPFLDADDGIWSRHLAVNLTGVFLTAQAAARAMVASGHGGAIVVVTSISAESPSAGTAPYVAAKGGARMLAEAMAWELGRYGIRVNCVAPGIVDTPLNADYLVDDEARSRAAAMVPLGRVAEPVDIADVVAFLASSSSRYVTGVTVRTDGGMRLGWTP
jgi:NAD(P)-dependent dehydrogenase (short-subunit alcohol dehydrogenase family)